MIWHLRPISPMSKTKLRSYLQLRMDAMSTDSSCKELLGNLVEELNKVILQIWSLKNFIPSFQLSMLQLLTERILSPLVSMTAQSTSHQWEVELTYSLPNLRWNLMNSMPDFGSWLVLPWSWLQNEPIYREHHFLYFISLALLLFIIDWDNKYIL